MRPKRPADGDLQDPDGSGRGNYDGPLCGNSCNDASDCDYGNNCLCASDAGIPLSATWGTFVCTYIADIAMAVAAATQLSKDCARGRCLLNQNGSIDVTATSTNVTISDSAIFRSSVPELTCPCNCTYVSQSCCLSSTGLVYEDAVKKVNTILQPRPNEAVCCDHQTGKWTNVTTAREGLPSNAAC